MSLLLALSGPRAISGVSPHCMPERTSTDAPGLQVHALTRPCRTAQRLRRLAEGADEGAAHPLRIAKAGYLRDALDRLAGGLHAMPGHLDPQPLHRVGVLSKPSSRRTVAISCPILSIIRPCFGQNCIECLAVRRPSGNLTASFVTSEKQRQ